MARLEMAGAEMATMAGIQPTGETLFELGIANATGREGAADLIAAHKWFNLAAVRGNEEAARHRQEIAREMTQRDLYAALRAARDWLSMH